MTVAALSALSLSLIGAPIPADGGPIAAARVAPSRPGVVDILTEDEQVKTLELGRAITEVKPSPGGNYVGVLALAKPLAKGGLPQLRLDIFDAEGVRLVSLAGAQRFAFALDDRTVAAVIGTPYEGGLGFLPEKVVLVSLPAGDVKVATGLEDAVKLAWLITQDGRMSLFAEVNRDEAAIVRYFPERDTVVPTKLLGLECSPDGKYYWLTPLETDRAGLCDPREAGARCIRAFTWKNVPIPLPKDRRLERGHVWASNTGHEMVFITRSGKSREAAILDLETGKLRPVEGRIDPSWQPRPGRVVLWRDKGPGRLRRLRKR